MRNECSPTKGSPPDWQQSSSSRSVEAGQGYHGGTTTACGLVGRGKHENPADYHGGHHCHCESSYRLPHYDPPSCVL
jgi:hypothetical protein